MLSYILHLVKVIFNRKLTAAVVAACLSLSLPVPLARQTGLSARACTQSGDVIGRRDSPKQREVATLGQSLFFLLSPSSRFKRKGVIVSRKTGEILRSFKRLSKAELKALDGVTIRGIRLNRGGGLGVGSRNIAARFFNYPDHEVEIDVDQGVITEVRIYDKEGKLVTDKESRDGRRAFAIITDTATGKYIDSYYKGLSLKRLKQYDKVTIRQLRLDMDGKLNIAGRKPYATFGKQYSMYHIEADFANGVVKEVRIYDAEGKLICDKDAPDGHRRFSIIIDRLTGASKASFWIGFGKRKLRELDAVTIKDIYLSKHGHLSLGGDVPATFYLYPRHRVEADLDHGIITEVRVYDEEGELIKDKALPNGEARFRFSVVVDRATGKYIRSFFEHISKSRFKKLDKVTIKEFRLNQSGILFIGGRRRAGFTKYPSHLVEIDVDEGVITSVRIYNERGQLIRTKETPDGEHRFALIMDRKTGSLLDSFWGGLSRVRFNRLDEVTIRRVYLNKDGVISIGGKGRRWWGGDTKYAGYPVEVDVDEGVIKTVRLYNKKGTLIRTLPFKVAYDSTGKAIDSFMWWHVPKRFSRLLGKIDGFRVEPFNGVKLRSDEVYLFDRWGDFSGKEVEVRFEDKAHPGRITSFHIGRRIIRAYQARSRIPEFIAEVEAERGIYRKVRGRRFPSPHAVAMRREFRRLLDEAVDSMPGISGIFARSIVKMIPEVPDSEEETREEIIARKLGISSKEVFAILRKLSEHPKLQDFKFEGTGKSPVLIETLDAYVSRVIRGGM